MDTPAGLPLDTTLAFDLHKQSAILGWCIRDKLFCAQCVHAVKPEWFSSPNVAKLYEGIVQLYAELGRGPSAQELKGYRPFSQLEAPRQQKIVEALAEALKRTEVYGLDLLRKEMTAWMHAVIFYQAMNKAQVLYNAKKVEEAWQVAEQATLMKITGTFEDGINHGFLPAEERLKGEKAERLVQGERLLSYGVKFLDDALLGIMMNDLIVIGAKLGAGKTQLATAIALSVARGGNPAHYFALEAEDKEIERRIKFGRLYDRYCKAGNSARLRYSDWRVGRLEKTFAPFEKEVEEEMGGLVKNLHTLYRTAGDFNLKALERQLMQVVGKTRLIVIDHLHYIDTEDKEENVAYKATMKIIRDIVLRFGVPVVVIAHLRKNQSYRTAPLVNSYEDFHGTSDVPKIATTAIMLGPADDVVPDASYLWPTYMNVVKSRMEGGVKRYTALLNFDARSGLYQPQYDLGRLNAARDEWEALPPDKLPPWADIKPFLTTHKL